MSLNPSVQKLLNSIKESMVAVMQSWDERRAYLATLSLAERRKQSLLDYFKGVGFKNITACHLADHRVTLDKDGGITYDHTWWNDLCKEHGYDHWKYPELIIPADYIDYGTFSYKKE